MAQDAQREDALVVANALWGTAYFDVQTCVGGLSILHWINDAMMAVFFLIIGLEIKREVLTGQPVTWPRRVLPALAALDGMAPPLSSTSPLTPWRFYAASASP